MAQITLSQGCEATIDDEDLNLVAGYKWHVQKKKRKNGIAMYAKAYSSAIGYEVALHRVILGITDPAIEVDHKDGNGLDCRRSNLRIATHAQNGANRTKTPNTTSRYKGVCLFNGWWEASLHTKKKRYALGRFTNELDAARAYNAGAIEHFGEFARLNVIPEAVAAAA
jgi:hypothetical protein